MRLALIACAGFLLPCSGQQIVPVPASIQQQDVPPIPAELAEDLARYDSARPAGFEGWHPVRREISARNSVSGMSLAA